MNLPGFGFDRLDFGTVRSALVASTDRYYEVMGEGEAVELLHRFSLDGPYVGHEDLRALLDELVTHQPVFKGPCGQPTERAHLVNPAGFATRDGAPRPAHHPERECPVPPLKYWHDWCISFGEST